MGHSLTHAQSVISAMTGGQLRCSSTLYHQVVSGSHPSMHRALWESEVW